LTGSSTRLRTKRYGETGAKREEQANDCGNGPPLRWDREHGPKHHKRLADNRPQLLNYAA
jgi:hypothetical protein